MFLVFFYAFYHSGVHSDENVFFLMMASFNGFYYIHYTFTCFSMVTSFIYEHTYNYYFLSKSFIDGVDNL